MSRTTDELIEELSAFLRIPSISSGDGTAEDLTAAATWVCERIIAAGGTAELVPTNVNPLVVGQLPSSTGAWTSPGSATEAHICSSVLVAHRDATSTIPVAAAGGVEAERVGRRPLSQARSRAGPRRASASSHRPPP